MKIGLISDTHIPEADKALLKEVTRIFEGVDLILHAGDLHVLTVLDWLEEIAPTMAAEGNGDVGLPYDPRLKRSHTFLIEGWKIGLVHTPPIPEQAPWRTIDKTMYRYFGGSVDILVFGDSHVETIIQYKNVILINPGSPTLPHNLLPQLGTVGLLDITHSKAEARIISLVSLTTYLHSEFYKNSIIFS